MSESRDFYIREFLANEGVDSLSAVLGEIRDGDQEEDYLDFGAVLQITDGANKAALEFGVFGATETDKDRSDRLREIENARAQARRLKGAVFLFAAKLDEALTIVEDELINRDQQARMFAGLLVDDASVEA